MKVLFIAEAVTLAHVGRSIRLASILHANGIDVELACDSRYRAFLTGLDFPVRSIQSVPTDTFLDALARGRPVFSLATLTAYVAEDLLILRESKADVVVGDFRLSLSVSARVAGIPYVNVTNAYWSPYARPHFRIPSLPFVPRWGITPANALFRMARPVGFAMHALPMNRLRRKHGLPGLGWDVRRVYCDGDLTVYADIPALVPTFNRPPTHRYIGPVLWSPPVVPPPWWNAVLNGEPPIYVSLGSSGPAQLLPMVVEALAGLDRPIVVATAGRQAPLPPSPRLWVADFVSGEAIAANACVVVCNGGSPTTHQALVHGVPVVGIASNLDQYLNIDYIQRFGAGSLLRADHASPSAIRAATRRAIEDAALRDRARAVAELAAAIDTDVEFPAAIAGLLGRRPIRGNEKVPRTEAE
jgi:UDP:flavonoid glycosyltransferase YjiC (YdhE family)